MSLTGDQTLSRHIYIYLYRPSNLDRINLYLASDLSLTMLNSNKLLLLKKGIIQFFQERGETGNP